MDRWFVFSGRFLDESLLERGELSVFEIESHSFGVLTSELLEEDVVVL